MEFNFGAFPRRNASSEQLKSAPSGTLTETATLTGDGSEIAESQAGPSVHDQSRAQCALAWWITEGAECGASVAMQDAVRFACEAQRQFAALQATSAGCRHAKIMHLQRFYVAATS